MFPQLLWALGWPASCTSPWALWGLHSGLCAAGVAGCGFFSCGVAEPPLSFTQTLLTSPLSVFPRGQGEEAALSPLCLWKVWGLQLSLLPLGQQGLSKHPHPYYCPPSRYSSVHLSPSKLLCCNYKLSLGVKNLSHYFAKCRKCEPFFASPNHNEFAGCWIKKIKIILPVRIAFVITCDT